MLSFYSRKKKDLTIFVLFHSNGQRRTCGLRNDTWNIQYSITPTKKISKTQYFPAMLSSKPWWSFCFPFFFLYKFFVRQKSKRMPLFTATIALGSVPGSLSFLSKLFTTTETSSTQCSPSGSPLLSPISNNLSKHSPRCCSRRTPWICSASNVSNNTESYGQAGTASARVLQDSSTPPEAVRQSQVRFVFYFCFFVFCFSH